MTGAHGLTVKTDARVTDCGGDFDAVVVPGGMPGASNIAGSEDAVSLTRDLYESRALVGAICAAPAAEFAITLAGILSGPKAAEELSDSTLQK